MLFVLLATWLSGTHKSFAYEVNVISLETVAEFVDDSYVPTYTCPEQGALAKIEQALALDGLSEQQDLALQSRKTHAQICLGDIKTAQSNLQRLLANENADRSARYYVSALYQYGFIYDLSENDERCNYYMLSRDAAKDQYSDINLSATLGFLNNCAKTNILEQLTQFYQLLENTSRSGDKGAQAQAHNAIGMYMSKLGQNYLAAEQYTKAHDIAKEIYEGANKLTFTLSAITTSLLSNDAKQANRLLSEFAIINDQSGTPLTKFHQYFSEAGYAILIQDKQKLKTALDNWGTVQEQNSNVVYDGLYRWYSSVLCLYEEDIECLQNFVEQEKSAHQDYKNYIRLSETYKKSMVEIQIMLGDKEAALEAFNGPSGYVFKVRNIQTGLQDTAKNYGVAKLHSKLFELESELASRGKTNEKWFIIAISVLLLIVAVLIYMVRKKYSQAKVYDEETGLLKGKAVIGKLATLPKPGQRRTNALAIFDINNFGAQNLSIDAQSDNFVLNEVASTLKKITRNSDILGRFSEHQFVLCLTDIEEEAAQFFFDRVKEALAEAFSDFSLKDTVEVDSSMSIYYGTESFDDIGEILDNLKTALSMKYHQA